MNRKLATLIGAQFLSAFADNAVLFTVIAMTMQQLGRGNWYIPALQGSFILAFILLTPWVGALADQHPKPLILLGANLVKALGAFLIAEGIEPLAGYAIIGIGAACYGPAKYGIIPEMTRPELLVRANGWVEGATIAAILLGTVAGARLADDSISSALRVIIALYLASGCSTLLLPKTTQPRTLTVENTILELSKTLRLLVLKKRNLLIILALSLFWSTAATLRVVLVAWAPAVLETETASQIADLTFFMALGIVVGAALVPRLIPLERLRRARFAAYPLSLMLALLAFTVDANFAKLILFGIGICGGIIVVPLNAAIQAVGHETIGSGRAVAAQNFYQNSAILLGMGIYALAASLELEPRDAMLILSIIALASALIIGRNLPSRP